MQDVTANGASFLSPIRPKKPTVTLPLEKLSFVCYNTFTYQWFALMQDKWSLSFR